MITEMNHSDSSNVVDPKMRRSPTTVCHPSRTPHLHTISLIRGHPRKLRDHHNKTTPAAVILLGRLMDATDSELVERYRNGDVRAFETLVHRYERQIFTVLLRYVGDQEAAEDLVQDTFTQVIENCRATRSVVALEAGSFVSPTASLSTSGASANDVPRTCPR